MGKSYANTRKISDLRGKVTLLLEIPSLSETDRENFVGLLEIFQEGPLEGLLHNDVEAYIEGLYVWHYKPDGSLRQGAFSRLEPQTA